MMNCMPFVEWIWKTQTWRYCGLRLLLLNLKGLFLLNGIYRPPPSTRADDIALENNIEKADLLNEQTILIGDSQAY